MSERRPFIGGNWKMNTTRATGAALAGRIAAEAADHMGGAGGAGGAGGVEIAIFPPFVYLEAVKAALDASNGASGGGATGPVALGGQDVYYEAEGAFTGEISPAMLVDIGAGLALTGHSERRHVLGESDEIVNRKTKATLKAGLGAVLCIGETLDQRQAGKTDSINDHQLRAALANVDAAALDRLIIAYEPVWAIGTGMTATPADAQDAHRAIRRVVADLYDDRRASAIRIIYGGSVKPDNAAELFDQPDIDGGLIGGASLKADDFLNICAAALKTARAA